MVSVSKFIREKKESFQAFKHSQQLRREHALKEDAIARRQRAGELAKAQGERVRAETDIKRIEGFTERHKEPSKLQKLGRGLSRVMNEQKEKSRSRPGLGSSARPESGRRAGSTLSRINEGSRGIDFGGNNTNESAFSQAARPLDYGRPAKREPPRKVIIMR